MGKSRLEAFSDGVLAIIITIMVLGLKVPLHGSPGALLPVVPVFMCYILSFIYVGIYWNNHHHMLHATNVINGAVLWANLHLLFWLSLIPFTTAWMGENRFASAPTALYGLILLMAAVAYLILQRVLLHAQGPDSLLAKALKSDTKGRLSPVLYLCAMPCAFVAPWIAGGLYVIVAVLWLIPDRRIERVLHEAPRNPPGS